MASVKTITATTTESTVEFSATYQFMWFRNYGENDCYICAHSGIVASADDVTLLKAGEVARLTLPQSPAQSKAYIKAADGSNTVEVHAQNFSDCPFKVSGKGGGQSITVEPLTVNDNGVYTAPTGKAYSPVTVDVQEQPWQPLQDGYSNFWFELTNDTLSPWLNFSAKTENAVIDWGDGSGEQALTTLTPTHTYAKAGKYVVKVKGVTGIAAQHNSQLEDGYFNELKYVELNNEVVDMSYAAFAYCTGLITFSAITISYNSLNFRYCCSLKRVICTSVTGTMNSYAFQYCMNLEDVNIPSGATSFDSYSLSYCFRIKSIILPSTVTLIGQGAFNSSINLSEIHIQSTNPPTLGTNVFVGIPSNYIIYVPVGTGDTYKAASGWSTYADHILEEGQTPNRMMLAKFNSTKTEEVKDDELYQDENR